MILAGGPCRARVVPVFLQAVPVFTHMVLAGNSRTGTATA